jgi:hypothetical protein
VLFVGVAAVVAPWLGTESEEREVVIRLARPADQLGVTWFDGDNVLWSASQRAPTGDLTRRLRLAPGRYRIEIEVVRGSKRDASERAIDVTADATQIVVPVDER